MIGPHDPRPTRPARRRLLRLLGGLGLLVLSPLRCGAAAPPPPAGSRARLSLREADFYRPHDPAG